MLTHLFLLDQCWDPAVEAQVISRAFRMGATGSVCVEQLLMKDTLEQTLHEMVTGKGHAKPNSEAGKKRAAAGEAVGEAGDEAGGSSSDPLPLPAPSSPGPAGQQTVRHGASGKRRMVDVTPAAPLAYPATDSSPAPRPDSAADPSAEVASAAARFESAAETSAAASIPPLAAASDQAKVHTLLKTMRFLRS
jgi:hypothetical protein